MDFSDLDVTTAADKGAEMQVRHPVTGEAMDASIVLLGSDSKTFRDIVRDRARDAMNQRKRKNVSLEEAEEQALSTLVRCTVSWKGVQEKGESLKCTPENVEHMYKGYPWLREQVDEFIGDRANFLKSA